MFYLSRVPPRTTYTVLSLLLIPPIVLSPLIALISAFSIFLPLIGFAFVPSLVGSLTVLAFTLPAFGYLQFAQSDPPPRERLPFVSLHPKRNVMLTLQAFRWGWYVLSTAWTVLRQWCLQQVISIWKRSQRVISTHIPFGKGEFLTVYHPKDLAQSASSSAEDSTSAITTITTNPNLRPILLLLPTPTSPFPSSVYLPLLALHLRAHLPFSTLIIHPSNSGKDSYPRTRLPQSARSTRRILRWINENAATYGGDITKVYVCGQSSGAVVALWAGGWREQIIKGREDWVWEKWKEGQIGLDGDGDGDEGLGNGLKRVDLWEEEEKMEEGDTDDEKGAVVKGMILLSPMTDIPLQIRHEANLYAEHVSATRRFFGPSQTESMLASPAHILFAARNVLNVGETGLNTRFLIIHGGKDEWVPVRQSVLLRELLVGLGVQEVSFRAYKAMGHLDPLLALMIGIKNDYSTTLLRDISNFIAPDGIP
ncbi:hypothetical protein [Phaffia rhodozyma]|uniref:Alpha/beta-hydrolase n=1 Tax=Phaffia rhodozyma TaxID=264483 RepID=A0A0F7SYF0_PHARH|nr:hypothetical protein [Phaffia rhodozyma]